MNLAAATGLALKWVEQDRIPDAVVRAGIRRLLQQRLGEIDATDAEAASTRYEVFVHALHNAPVAVETDRANEQHYEVPAAFFEQVLGPLRKYSGCWWPEGVDTLAQAEEAALAETCRRAQLADGQRVLELGCGWGSLSLWMASHYPNSRITAISNSSSQRAFIEAQCAARGLDNLTVLTRNAVDFDTEERYDRIVSVEMFEHMRNWPMLFERIGRWLAPEGLFFMHVFAHRSTPYFFEDRDDSDWMSRHFFSGGMMPADDLPLRFQDHLQLKQRWRWDGRHYERTANAWLANMDEQVAEVLPLLRATYGATETTRWWVRWRLFFMSVAELFGYDNGQQWWVSHYLFSRR